MVGRIGVGLFVVGTVLMAATAGCSDAEPASGQGLDSVELRSYTVPAEYKNELRSALSTALDTGEARVGRVTSGPGNTIIVVGPPRVQAGVGDLVRAGFGADSSSPAPSPAPPITMTYWLLVGRPLANPSSQSAFALSGPRQLPALQEVFAQIASAEGPTEFALLEQIRLTAQNSGGATGRFATINQSATRTGEQVTAEVTINLNQASQLFQGQLVLTPGRFLVFAQAGYRGSVPASTFSDVRLGVDALTVYCVVSATVES